MMIESFTAVLKCMRATLPCLYDRNATFCALLRVAMEDPSSVRALKRYTAMVPMHVVKHRAIRDPQDAGKEINYHEKRVDPPTTVLRVPARPRRELLHEEYTTIETRNRSREYEKRGCCETDITHDFGCVCLDRKSLPPSFQSMLKILSHILGYLLIPDALLKLGRRTREHISIRRLIPELTYVMQMGLDWDVRNVYPFLELLLRYYGLHRQVFCGADRSGQGGVDVVIALKPMSERENPQNFPAPQAVCEPCIPMCLVVIQRDPRDDPIDRLRTWLSDNLEWLEKNDLVPTAEHWPVPYFLVDNNKWTFGFAVRSESGFMLYEEFISSMGWQNGVQKIVVILKLVIESTIQRHSEWFYERFPQYDSSDDEACCCSGKVPVLPVNLYTRVVGDAKA